MTDTAEFASAFVAACGELVDIDKSAKAGGGQKQYLYAPLEEVLEVVRPVLARHGLAAVQNVSTEQAGSGVAVDVVTEVLHVSGASRSSPPLRLFAQADAQSVGSAITYARRYSLMATLGITSTKADDDGAAARHVPPSRSLEPRTDSERTIRQVLNGIDDGRYRVALQDAFKREFGSNLAGLDPARHVEAHQWLIERLSADIAHEQTPQQLLDPEPDDE